MSRLDEPALEAFLESAVGPADDLAVEGEGAGYSNETLFVRWGDRELVVRRPPPDETAESAHDVLREYRILEALQGTAVPVPNTVCAGEDESVLGTEFYVMDRLEGEVIRTDEPERFATLAGRDRLADEFVDALAAVHGVDYGAVGLGDLGRPATSSARSSASRRPASGRSTPRPTSARSPNCTRSAPGWRRTSPSRPRTRWSTATTSSTT